jgi:hypothetical protein
MAENPQVMKVVPDDTTPDMANEQNEQAKPNPFAPESLRLDLNVAEGLGVKKVVATIPVRKPGNQDYVRVHSSPDFRLPVALIELRDEREVYLVRPHVARDIPGEYFAATMYTTINRAGVVFLWPVRLPGTDGRQLAWHTSAAEAAEAAMEGWVRVKADMSLGAYVWWEASSTIPEPTWPKDLTFERMLEIAFKNGRLVESLDHPVLKQLRGEA